jgi:hypothetical protein
MLAAIPQESPMAKVTIRALFFKQADHWIGQCLEYDIGAQASDLDTARSRLRMALDLEKETSLELTGEAFKGIAPAPEYFHAMWEKRSREPQRAASSIMCFALDL